MMPLPEMLTTRLRIRPYTEDDFSARVAFDKEINGQDTKLEDTRHWLKWTIASYREQSRLDQPPYGDYAITLSEGGPPIGAVGLVPALIPWGVLTRIVSADEDALVSPEFGLYWAVLPKYRGQGYAAEAAKSLIDRVFAGLSARRVVATTDYDNHASRRVMEKLNMTIMRNDNHHPDWCQLVGVLNHPGLPPFSEAGPETLVDAPEY